MPALAFCHRSFWDILVTILCPNHSVTAAVQHATNPSITSLPQSREMGVAPLLSNENGGAGSCPLFPSKVFWGPNPCMCIQRDLLSPTNPRRLPIDPNYHTSLHLREHKKLLNLGDPDLRPWSS